MNREIKFRLWDGQKIREVISIWDQHIEHAFAHYVVRGKYECETLFESDKHYPLMQFTGLHDKNGEEIYEGDILRYRYSRDTTGKDIIEFNEVVERENTTDFIGWPIHKSMEFEVIGNIYSTPELIK